MMRILGPALAILLALGAYLLFGRSGGGDEGREAPAAEAAGEPSPVTGESTKTAGGKVLPTPLRMRSERPEGGEVVAPVASELSLAEGFSAEETDTTESAAHSELIRNVVEELAEAEIGTARIEELECRSQHCKLRLASGNSEGLVKLVDALQDERGFLGKAESLMLSRVEDDIVFYLRFPRPK